MKRISQLANVIFICVLLMQIFSCNNKKAINPDDNVRTIKPSDIDTVKNCGRTIDDSLTINKLLAYVKSKQNLSRTSEEDDLLMDVLVSLDDKGFMQKATNDTLIFIIQNHKFNLKRMQFNECHIQQEKILRKYPKSFKQKIFLLYFTENITTLDSVSFYSPKRISIIGNSQYN